MSHLDYKINSFSEEFLGQILELVGEGLVETGVLKSADLPLTDDDLFNIEETYGGRGGFWMAVKKKEVIGTVGLRDMDKGVAKLKRMFVRKDYQGFGVGGALLSYALEHAKKKGFSKVMLNSHKNMFRAHVFYEKHGFVKTGELGTKRTYELALES